LSFQLHPLLLHCFRSRVALSDSGRTTQIYFAGEFA
jgi:hypothetical protein